MEYLCHPSPTFAGAMILYRLEELVVNLAEDSRNSSLFEHVLSQITSKLLCLKGPGDHSYLKE